MWWPNNLLLTVESVGGVPKSLRLPAVTLPPGKDLGLGTGVLSPERIWDQKGVPLAPS